MYTEYMYKDSLAHHGILGQKWGRRRYQNADGSYTPEGRARYGIGERANKFLKGEADADRAISRKHSAAIGSSKTRLGKAYHNRVAQLADYDAAIADNLRKRKRFGLNEARAEAADKYYKRKAGYTSKGKYKTGTRRDNALKKAQAKAQANMNKHLSEMDKSKSKLGRSYHNYMAYNSDYNSRMYDSLRRGKGIQYGANNAAASNRYYKRKKRTK